MNPKVMNVRARSLSHLEALVERFPDLLGGREVISTEHSGYPHRLIVPKGVWRKVVDGLTAEIGYDNFKGEVARSGGSASHQKALHEVWAAGRGIV